MEKAARVLFAASLLTYAASFLLPTFQIVVDGKATSESGYSAFVLSFAAPGCWFPAGMAPFLIWLANPA